MKKSGELDSIENDFANLARLAAGAAYEDTRLFLARLVRKYRQQRPEFAARLDQSLKASQARSAGSSILRRDMPLPPQIPQGCQQPIHTGRLRRIAERALEFPAVVHPLEADGRIRCPGQGQRRHLRRHELGQ